MDDTVPDGGCSNTKHRSHAWVWHPWSCRSLMPSPMEPLLNLIDISGPMAWTLLREPVNKRSCF